MPTQTDPDARDEFDTASVGNEGFGPAPSLVSRVVRRAADDSGAFCARLAPIGETGVYMVASRLGSNADAVSRAQLVADLACVFARLRDETALLDAQQPARVTFVARVTGARGAAAASLDALGAAPAFLRELSITLRDECVCLFFFFFCFGFLGFNYNLFLIVVLFVLLTILINCWVFVYHCSGLSGSFETLIGNAAAHDVLRLLDLSYNKEVGGAIHVASSSALLFLRVSDQLFFFFVSFSCVDEYLLKFLFVCLFVCQLRGTNAHIDRDFTAEHGLLGAPSPLMSLDVRDTPLIDASLAEGGALNAQAGQPFIGLQGAAVLLDVPIEDACTPSCG